MHEAAFDALISVKCAYKYIYSFVTLCWTVRKLDNMVILHVHV